jgi:hypothetical protein
MAKARNQTTVTTPPTAPRPSGDTTAATLDRERIAHRAYELFMARGGADGQDLEDWLEAERELEREGNGDRDR